LTKPPAYAIIYWLSAFRVHGHAATEEKMIEVNAVFTKEKIKDMSKTKRISNYIIFPLLALVMLGAGIAVLFYPEREKTELIVAILLMVASPVVVFLTFYMTRNELKANYESFGVNKDTVTLNYRFSPEGIVIRRTTLGKTVTENIAFRELYKVKRTKKCFMLFVSKEEMFYVPTDCFVSGTPDDLFKLFYNAKVILDY